MSTPSVIVSEMFVPTFQWVITYRELCYANIRRPLAVIQDEHAMDSCQPISRSDGQSFNQGHDSGIGGFKDAQPLQEPWISAGCKNTALKSLNPERSRVKLDDDTRERQKPSKRLYSSLHALGLWDRLKTTKLFRIRRLARCLVLAWEIYATATGTAAQPWSTLSASSLRWLSQNWRSICNYQWIGFYRKILTGNPWFLP